MLWVLTGTYRLYNVTIVGDGLGVDLHMKIIICVLPDDTSNSSDCVMPNVLLSGEFNGKTFNGYHALTGSTVSTFS